MACAASTSTRFVASSSYRAHKSRTLSIHSPISSLHPTNTPACGIWIGSLYSSPRSVGLRRVPWDARVSQRLQQSWSEPFPPSPATGALCWEYLRRHVLTGEGIPPQPSTKKHLSAIMAFALCFLASASTATTTHGGSTGTNPSTKFQGGGGGGGGLGPHKTKPVFLFSKLKAEKEVQQVQEEASRDPYLVSSSKIGPDVVSSMLHNWCTARSTHTDISLFVLLRRFRKEFSKAPGGPWRIPTR